MVDGKFTQNPPPERPIGNRRFLDITNKMKSTRFYIIKSSLIKNFKNPD